jgi:GTPase Era involved in 16S rRNA processing
MIHPVQSLQTEIDETVRLLDRSFLFSFTKGEKQSLLSEAEVLSHKLSSIENSFLTAGLLGGTGVGKSTLMNALAGSEIASTSHRRPHTDAVLIYRHAKANPLSSGSVLGLPWREIAHEEKAIQQILLCDLPDYDSMLGEHRKYVFEFMEHLDVLIWVTSPEKYADGRFYEVLQQVPKARQNFYFVLNKVDLLFQGNKPETGYEQMARVASQFQRHIKKTGIEAPLLYTLSSKDALHSDELAPWNHFPAFRQQIFQQRDMKQIRAIKGANLDVEIQQLHCRLEKEVLNLKAFERLFQHATKELEALRSQWIQAGNEAIDLWLRRQIGPEVLSRQSNPKCLVGPSRTLAIVLGGLKKPSVDEGNRPLDAALFMPSEDVLLTFRRRFEWLEERLHHHILRDNLPSAFQEWVREKLDTAKEIEDLKERFSHGVALRLQERTSTVSWRFKTTQYVTYSLLLVLFLFVIGGETAWREIFAHPGGQNVLHLILSGVHTLFSTKGLAALGSYVVLNLIFSFRFYRRYKHLQEVAAEKMIESLKGTLGKIWEEELAEFLDQMNHLNQKIEGKISAIANLRQRNSGASPTSAASKAIEREVGFQNASSLEGDVE